MRLFEHIYAEAQGKLRLNKDNLAEFLDSDGVIIAKEIESLCNYFATSLLKEIKNISKKYPLCAISSMIILISVDENAPFRYIESALSQISDIVGQNGKIWYGIENGDEYKIKASMLIKISNKLSIN